MKQPLSFLIRLISGNSSVSGRSRRRSKGTVPLKHLRLATLKKSRTLLLLSTLSLAVLLPLVYFSLRSPPQSEAAWYNTSWIYRQPIVITNNSGGTLTNPQIQVVVNTASLITGGKLQSDCDDIRFATSGGSLLTHWQEHCFSSGSQKSSYWVTIPSLPSGDTTIYVYYSNGAASSTSSYSSEPTGINVGTNNDGSITVSSDTNINTANSISGRSCADGGDAVNYTVTENRASGTNQIVLSSTPSSGCLAVGDEILIINLQGTTGVTSDVGEYETARITNISTATLTLNRTLTNGYNGTNQKIMVQRVPNYNNVTISTSGTDFTASSWNGTKGGVMMFRTFGTLTVDASTTVNSGSGGYRGGPTNLNGTAGVWRFLGEGFAGGYNTTGSDGSANSEGGGPGITDGDDGSSSGIGGGGGAGYGTAGSNGSQTQGSNKFGIGGSTYGVNTLTTLFHGSGGGSGGHDHQVAGRNGGAGGTGGGIVFVSAKTLTLNGTIQANASAGADSTNNGCGGGGGSGGSVLLAGSTLTLGTSKVTASSGAAGNSSTKVCAGGAGGVGRVATRYSSSSGTTSPTATTSVLGVAAAPGTEEGLPDAEPSSPNFVAGYLHDKLKTTDTTPEIRFSSSDGEGNDLVYQVEWAGDASFTGSSTATSDTDAGFVNLVNGGDTSPFNSDETIGYTWQSALTNGNTYFYRVRAKDPAGSNTYSDWSATRSFTIDTALVNRAWYETHADQFATDDLEANIEVDDAGNFAYIDPTGAPAFSRPITITNSGSLLTDHHTLLTIDTAALIAASKVQSDCDDLRFYDDNDAQLTYWIENGCNTSTTKIWVEIPSLPNGDTDITMYYGNSLATQGSEAYSGNFIGGFDGTCPGGWTAMSTLNTGNYYIRGGTAAVGTTGGSATHSHATSLTTGTPSTTDTAPNASGDNDNTSASNHTHSWTGSTATATNTPPYYDLVFCQYTGIPTDFGTSYVGMFGSTPSGWTRFSALDDRFIRANSSAGGTGGSSTHTHSLSGTFPSIPTTLADNGDNDRQVSRNSHTHSFSTTTGSASSLPAYYTSIFAKPNSTEALREGQIAMMTSNTTPPLGWTRYTALDDKMPYGSATFGSTGGADTNTHAVSSFTTGSDGSSVSVHSGGGSSAAETGHTHSVNATNTSAANILPPYYTMSFYQRLTDPTTKAIGSEVSSLRRLMISTPIEAENITTARWNEFTFNDDTTDGNISYRIYYDNGGVPTLVPNSVLSGNTAGFSASPVDLSPLSVEEYPILYLGADMFYSNGSPELNDWQITFNEPPETPTLLAPTNGGDLTTLSPVFQASTTDFESDYLRYKIEMCTTPTMDDFACQTFDQTVSQTNWSGQNAQTSTAYNSGSTATYSFPTQLPINTTYYWRAYAIDPGGSDWWSETQSPVWSFTTPNLVRPQVCLVEESPDDDSIIIRWDDPNIVETGYEIERNLSAAGFSAFSTTAANVVSDVDNSVSPDNSYQYRIRALLGASTTDWCTTPLLQIETGSLLLEGVQGEGLRID